MYSPVDVNHGITVGITREALKRFHHLNYRRKSGEGLTRAHLRPRVKTVEELLNRDAAMSEPDFIEYWFKHDRTVICGKGENKPVIAGDDVITFDNPNGSLFSSNSVAWKHGKAESDLLKDLYVKHFGGAAPDASTHNAAL